jgi:hypothetical protein
MTAVAALLLAAAAALAFYTLACVARLVYDMALRAAWFGIRWQMCMWLWHKIQESSDAPWQRLFSDPYYALRVSCFTAAVCLVILATCYVVKRQQKSPLTATRMAQYFVLDQLLYVSGFFLCITIHTKYEKEMAQGWEAWETFTSQLLRGGSPLNNSRLIGPPPSTIREIW